MEVLVGHKVIKSLKKSQKETPTKCVATIEHLSTFSYDLKFKLGKKLVSDILSCLQN